MAIIVFDETTPADADNLGQGDDQIRALKIALRTAMDAEHIFPAGGGDAGAHRLGSGRAYIGVQSRVSSSGTDGKLMVTSDTSRLYHVGSQGTMFLGSSRVLENINWTGDQRYRWTIESGIVSVAAGATGNVALISSFGATPIVMASVASSAVGAAYITAVSPSPTQFSVRVFLVSSGGTLIPTASATTVQYVSLGTSIMQF